jgi:hypothetical protein
VLCRILAFIQSQDQAHQFLSKNHQYDLSFYNTRNFLLKESQENCMKKTIKIMFATLKYVPVRCALVLYDRPNKHVDDEVLMPLKIYISTSRLNLNIKKNKTQRFNILLSKMLLYQFEA